jgi:hypothetical protein
VKDVDVKAVRYVASGRVTVHSATFGPDSELVTAEGTVRGAHVYKVHITPGATTCTCDYGQHRTDAAGHAHDQALRLAAQHLKEREGL